MDFLLQPPVFVEQVLYHCLQLNSVALRPQLVTTKEFNLVLRVPGKPNASML